MVMDVEVERKLTEKVKKYLDRRYIVPVKTITTAVVYFAVSKGEEGDIRPVWSVTENGVNPSVFAPRFYMPTCNTLCRKIYPCTCCADFDVGEMFLNFNLHPSERRFH